MLDNGRSIRIFGEIVGSAGQSTQGPVSAYSDGGYPGGKIINYTVKDELKAQYVASQIAEGDLAEFTYLLLPNDHGNGISPTVPTPESMVADNDIAVGIVVDALSKSPLWMSSMIIVVEDDPQGCGDHVEPHRSFTMVISPWARRGYVSSAHYSYAHVFATINRALGVPPLGRGDAAAAPMYDMFTSVPDPTPFDHLPRAYPEEFGLVTMPGYKATRCLDFRSADRNPELEVIYDEYFAWRRGEKSAAEADAAINTRIERMHQQEGERGDEDDDDELGRVLAGGDADEHDEEDDEEEDAAQALAFDLHFAAINEERLKRGEAPIELPPLGPAPDCERSPATKRLDRIVEGLRDLTPR
jgi:hypothetical protein